MTRQEIRKSIIGCAAELKHVPSLEELLNMTPVSHRQIIKHFGGYIAALRDTGLELKSTVGRGHGVPMGKLFADWARIVQKLKRLPSMNDYYMLSSYSTWPLMRRFGAWRRVPHGLKKFAETHGLAGKWKRELALVQAAPAPKIQKDVPGIHPRWSVTQLDRPFYGAPLWPGPSPYATLAYAPLNELGVIFLFGAMAWQLGFVVHKLQADFPDCEAMRRVSEDRCQLVKIEFERHSRNFLKHGHGVKGCDWIVYWRHSWTKCPREVREEVAAFQLKFDFYELA